MRRGVFIGFVCAILFPTLILAQIETGGIAGVVTDPSGAVVPGAKVTITSVGKQTVRTVSANSRGEYAINNLEPGSYDVVVEQQGFTSFKRRLDVTVGSRNTIDAQLTVGTAGTTVEVTAQEGVQVETQSQALSQVVTATEMTQLPTI